MRLSVLYGDRAYPFVMRSMPILKKMTASLIDAAGPEDPRDSRHFCGSNCLSSSQALSSEQPLLFYFDRGTRRNLSAVSPVADYYADFHLYRFLSAHDLVGGNSAIGVI